MVSARSIAALNKLFDAAGTVSDGGHGSDPRWKIMLILAGLCLLIIGCYYVAKLVHKFHIRIFTESGILMIVGMIISLIDWLFDHRIRIDVLFTFNTIVFDFFVLPAIIFESGYSLRKKGLFRNFLTIMLYAVVATLFNALFIGFLSWAFSKIVPGIDPDNPIEGLIFGSLMSATDTVAILAVMTDVLELSKRPYVPLLYNLIFGESIINDAVAIVVYRIFSGFVHEQFTYLTVLKMIGMFCYISIGSAIIGIIFGLISSILFKYISLKEHHAMELITLVLMAFISYFVAEAITLSGIISLFSCSVVIGRFTWYNLSEYSRVTTPQTFKALASLADTYCFFYLGVSVFNFTKPEQWRFGFASIVVGLVFMGRFISHFSLSIIANIWRKEKIQLKEMLILWIGGLRGAMAFVLALHSADLGLKNYDVIVTTTLVVVLFTLLIVGSLTYPVLWCIKAIPKPDSMITDDNPSAILVVNKFDIKPRERGVIGHPKLDGYLKAFEKKVLMPLLRKRHDDTSTLLRDLLISGAVPESMRITEMDFNDPRFEYIKALALKKEKKLGLSDIGKSIPAVERKEGEGTTGLIELQDREANGDLVPSKSEVNFASLAASMSEDNMNQVTETASADEKSSTELTRGTESLV